MPSFLDASALIASFATGTYAVTRRAAATTDTHGRAVAGATSTLSITAAIVPTSGHELQRLPELRRNTETRTLYTTTLLRAGGPGTGYEADLVTIAGVAWEVENVRAWPAVADAYEVTLQAPAGNA